jgi:hypothetical protein
MARVSSLSIGFVVVSDARRVKAANSPDALFTINFYMK